MLRGMFAAALSSLHRRRGPLSPEERRARDEAKEQKRAERKRQTSQPRYVPVLPVVLFDTRSTPASVALHRERIAASRRGEGPFYTAPKDAP